MPSGSQHVLYVNWETNTVERNTKNLIYEFSATKLPFKSPSRTQTVAFGCELMSPILSIPPAFFQDQTHLS